MPDEEITETCGHCKCVFYSWLSDCIDEHCGIPLCDACCLLHIHCIACHKLLVFADAKERAKLMCHTCTDYICNDCAQGDEDEHYCAKCNIAHMSRHYDFS